MRRRTVVVGALVAGALVLATAGQTWVHATGLDGGVVQEARASGRQAAPVAAAMALVVMAAALALTTARRLGARLVGVLMALAGVVVASTAVTAALDPVATAASAVAQATGTTAPAADYAVTAWPWVAAVGGLLAVTMGLLALVAGGRWTQSRRYEAPAAVDADTAPGASPRGTVDQMDAWDSLSRGDDPT